MSVQVFALPDLGEGLTEAEIVRWLVAVGDEITVDQPVVEVETAKSLVEVPSPFAGRVAELHGDEGAAVDVGKPLLSVGAADSAEDAPTTAPTTTPVDGPDAEGERYREEEQAGSGNVLIGYGTSAPEGAGRRRRRRTELGAPETAEAAVPDRPANGRALRVTSPLVRNLARTAGVSLGSVPGSGPDGLITRRDVQAEIDNRQSTAAPAAETAQAAPPTDGALPVADRTGLAVAKRTPMSGFRKSVSAALTRSRSEIPEATVWVDVDFTDLVALREAGRTANDPGPGLMAYLARFTTAALHAYPELNGEIDEPSQELVQYDGINLGVAVQTERGLMVPAIPRADRLSAVELDSELRRVTAAARDGKTTPEELNGGTFTLNNYGAFNVDGSAAIINHPQVAILGFGRVIHRPWVVDGQLAVRKIAQMSFVFDHRVCDGGAAAGFMRIVADAIENPLAAVARL